MGEMMQKRIGLFLLFLLTFALWGPRQALARTGYDQTVTMWREVEARVRPYQLALQNLYAEVESEVGLEKSRLNLAFAQRLSLKYPGSNFVGGSYGKLAVNNYTKLGFDSRWNIISLSQQFGSLVKTYDFPRKTLLMVNGPNRVKLHLDLRQPSRSQFTEATIPALVVTARDIRARQRMQDSRWPLRDVLNDVYAHRIAGQARTRMDELAEQMIDNEQTRQMVLSLANDLYSRSMVQGATKKVSPLRPDPPKVKSQKSPSFSLFSLLPWYFWPGIIGISIVSALTSTKGRRRKPGKGSRKGDIPSEREHDDGYEPAFESRQTLHSPAEQAFLLVLEQAIDGERFLINGKTRLADLIQVEKQQWGSQWQAQFNRISRKHVDFVILERSSSRIIGVIELDDSSHLRPDRRKRDQFVDRALERAGIPILHYPCLRDYPLANLQNAIQQKFEITGKDFVGEGDWRWA